MLNALISMLQTVRDQADAVQLSVLPLKDAAGARAGAGLIVTYELRDKTYETRLTLTSMELATATEPQFEAAVGRLCADALAQLADAQGARMEPDEAERRLFEASQQSPRMLALTAIADAAKH